MPLTTPDFLLPLLEQPIAILGGGVSGQGVTLLLQAIGRTGVVYDAKDLEFTPEAAKGHRLAVYSPGFSAGHPWLVRAGEAGCLTLGELDFASLFWRGRILAITGTNGKTTLTEFLAHALVSAGRGATATGNVGHAFSRLAATAGGGSPEMTAVCEVSSFQAESLRHFRAEAALWTNFAEDHLERHPGLDAYFAAKAMVAARSSKVFAGSSVKAYFERGTGERALLDGALGQAVFVQTENRPHDLRLAGTVFAEYPQRENFLLALAWWAASGLSEADLYKAARSFKLGRHRLGIVAEVDGVTYWNDSKATNFHAVEAALARFDRPVFLIAGGKGKGGDLTGFISRITPRVQKVFLIGDTRSELARACVSQGVEHGVFSGLAEAVQAASDLARPGDHVLLSPAFASFDQFRNYEDRGEQFERLVREHLLPAHSSST